MQRDDRRLTGTLRIAAPFGYGRQYVAPMLARFARLHPGLHMQLDLRETPWPDRHDADAVIHIGAVRDSSWVARTLSANERWLCASPDYLRLHGTPRVPRDVMAHDCICIRENDEDVTLWHAPGEGRGASEARQGKCKPAATSSARRAKRCASRPPTSPTTAAWRASGPSKAWAWCCAPSGTRPTPWRAARWCACCPTGSSTAPRSCCWCRRARGARRACRRCRSFLVESFGDQHRAAFQQQAPRVGQVHDARAAVKQPHADLRFEFGDVFADRRFRQLHRRCGACQVAMPGDFAKRLDKLKAEGCGQGEPGGKRRKRTTIGGAPPRVNEAIGSCLCLRLMPWAFPAVRPATASTDWPS
jgi:DNA-binding transcriptional LysR family regulator